VQAGAFQELQSWDLIQVTHTLGDRRDFFLAPHDPWEVIRIVVEGRKRREIDPTLAFLRDCAVTLQKDSETPPEVRERIVAQMETPSHPPPPLMHKCSACWLKSCIARCGCAFLPSSSERHWEKCRNCWWTGRE
jgi:hypothetical protein